MIVLAFVTVYAACAALLLAVLWQDRRRGAERDGRESSTSHASDFDFRTQA